MVKSTNPVKLNDSWSQFDWSQYPGGVCVSFGLVHDRALLLVKSSRWSTTMPALYLRRGGNLADVWARQMEQLRVAGVDLGGVSLPTEISACYSDGRTYHVLIMVSCQKYGPVNAVERVDDALLLSGYASGCAMACFAAHAMKWGDASRYLPLPEGAGLISQAVAVSLPAPKPPVMTATKSRQKKVPVLADAAGQ